MCTFATACAWRRGSGCDSWCATGRARCRTCATTSSSSSAARCRRVLPKHLTFILCRAECAREGMYTLPFARHLRPCSELICRSIRTASDQSYLIYQLMLGVLSCHAVWLKCSCTGRTSCNLLMSSRLYMHSAQRAMQGHNQARPVGSFAATAATCTSLAPHSLPPYVEHRESHSKFAAYVGTFTLSRCR